MITALDNFSKITAAILAGGSGTRLRPTVSDRQKVVAKIGERPFLTFLLDQLASIGVRDVVLCTGYLGERVHTILGNSYATLNLIYSQESSPLGTGGALRLAMPHFKSDTVLVMNGDSFCDADFKGFLAWHHHRKAKATLILVEVSETGQYGRVVVSEDNAVLSFEEKDGKSDSGWINAGIYLLSQNFLLTIPENDLISLEKKIFPAWIGKGLYGYPCKARFIDIGTPGSYARAGDFFARLFRSRKMESHIERTIQ